ncbi:Gfo/Idh/MocA family oxidoreductase [Halobacillus sp. HZG1]|uniref:Gfo/Idh/MocA family protein n=1 Tax=Halobacillus sp. HZG1 TaxID=3111769 RepID=UPI002DBC362D|nr:Gfo/Idh/MocA family oxidoreductase [Halobacillus sp. HZG1]MEC3882958.1 Gfo/Idh/MocA family oxidoreductase [Halobacillus sp. HZG1]
MVKFGIIGTNTITEKFIEAAKQHDHFTLQAVYSRTEDKAAAFASKHGVRETYTDIEKMASSSNVDAIYIASPNAFHAEQAKTIMRKGTHILCEKPMASNQQEIASMIEVAKEEGVVLMEAVKSTLMPGFLSIQEHLHKIGKVRRFVGNFSKYSSRYDAYKRGEVLNAFKPELSNGSLMDLGIYGIYPMVALFGAPNHVQANAVFLDSGVDGQGSVIAAYDDMEGVVVHSKIVDSHAPSEIQGEKGTMLIPNISEPKDIKIMYRDGSIEELIFEDEFSPMYYEAAEFISLVEKEKSRSENNSLEHTLITAKVMEEARRQIGLVYPNDRS